MTENKSNLAYTFIYFVHNTNVLYATFLMRLFVPVCVWKTFKMLER